MKVEGRRIRRPTRYVYCTNLEGRIVKTDIA